MLKGYTPICILFFIVFAVISDLSNAENLKLVKMLFLDYFLKDSVYTHTIMEISEVTSEVMSTVNIITTTFVGSCVWTLPVNNFFYNNSVIL